MTGHKHAEAMAMYAEDAKIHPNPGELWEYKTKRHEWRPLENRHPLWREQLEYRRKPRTININGIEVPEPLRVGEVKCGDIVYIASISACTYFQSPRRFDNCKDFDCQALLRGVLHSSEEAAVTHAKALVSFTRGF